MDKPRAAIPGFDGYEVDREGVIWSRWKRVGSPRNGTAGFAICGDWRPLKGIRKKNGYICINLKGSKGLVRNLTIHSLVLLAFVGPAPDGHECRHLDGNRSNNRRTNLKWGTKAENEADRELHGTIPRGESHGCAKLTAKAVIAIRTKHANGVLARALAADHDVTTACIHDIVSRRSWSHV